MTAIEEVAIDPDPATSDVSSVRYYDLNGHGSSKPFEGINIEVTTHSNKTRNAKKVIRAN